MDPEAFRKHAKEMVDFVADYWETIRDRQPLPDVKPGYIKDLVFFSSNSKFFMFRYPKKHRKPQNLGTTFSLILNLLFSKALLIGTIQILMLTTQLLLATRLLSGIFSVVGLRQLGSLG